MKKIYTLGFVLMVLLSMTMSAVPSVLAGPDYKKSSVSVGPAKVVSWNDIPTGNVGTYKEIALPIGHIKYKEIRPRPIKSDVKPKQEVDIQKIQPFQPNLISGFDSIDNKANQLLNGFLPRPPDPIIAAGSNHVVVMVNDIIALYNKANNNMVGEKTLGNFYGSVFASCSSCFISDPRIVYDQNENHWIAIALGIDSSTSPYTTHYLIAVSNGADPTGLWVFYSVPSNFLDAQSNINTWSDYPDVGFDGIPSTNSGSVYITSNQFDPTNQFFITSLITVLPKSSLYSGGALVH